MGVDAAADPYVGRTILGRYRLDKRIGAGGMGTVYQAEHVLMGKPVAVKLLHGDLARIPQAVARFEREARSLSSLSHPNLVNATDFGETEDGNLFLVMELCEGPSLSRILKKEVRLDVQRAGKMALQILAAVDAAHAQGVIHRDLKPDNILLVEHGDDPEFVKILDFGIAKMIHTTSEDEEVLTRSGMVFGTPEYLSPEQGLGKGADHRSDLYAVAVMLYELLTGVRPFRAPDKMDLIAQHITQEPEPLRRLAPQAGIPVAVERVVLKGLEKKPENRHQFARHFADELREALASNSTQEERTLSTSGSDVVATAVEAGRAMGTTLIRAFRPDFWRSLGRGELSTRKAATSIGSAVFLLLAVLVIVLISVIGPGENPDDQADVGTATSDEPFIPFLYDPVNDARKLLEKGEGTQALDVIDAALREHPENAKLYVERAHVLEHLGRWKEATTAYSAAMRFDSALRDDEELLTRIIVHLEQRGADVLVTRDLLKSSAGATAVTLLAARLEETHQKVMDLRVSMDKMTAEKTEIPAELVAAAAEGNRLRINYRRTLEALGGGGVDLLPYLIDELRFVDNCLDLKAYVLKFGKIGDPRFLPTLHLLVAKGYGKAGNPCLKKVLPEVMKGFEKPR